MAVFQEKVARPSPENLRGPIHCIKENLLATPLDVIQTILIIAFLVWTIPPFLDWAIFNASFVGHTKADALGSGANWIFIKEKIGMFIYGFYPKAELYRIDIVFALFFVIVVLFKFVAKTITQKAVVFLIYPIAAFILIKGGYFGLAEVTTDKWGGVLLTLVIASVGIVLSLPIGIILAFGRQSKLPIIKNLSVFYIEFIRGVPLITMLFMGSVLLPLFFQEGVELDKLLRALIVITMVESAFISEAIRGGLQAIPKGQYEAADSLGLGYWQKMILVILPQALKVAIPNIVGISIELFKDTSLVMIIGLFDLLSMVHLAANDSHWLGMETEGYVFVTFIYWIFCYSMSKYSMILEDRFNTNNK
jgi:general L-amino acid transport system permease protein